MRRIAEKIGTAAFAALALAAPVSAYDHDLADAYAALFAPVQGEQAGKQLHLMKPDRFVERVKMGKPVVTVDIRTPEETRYFTGNLPGHLTIPLSALFQHEQLAKLPSDQPIVVMCKSGARATAAVTGLRSIGFDDAWVLKGGFKALSGYLGAPEANMVLDARTAAR